MHRSALRVFAPALALMVAVAGCSRGSHSDASSAATPSAESSGPVYPAGVLSPAPGLYPADAASQCCFLGDHATLTLQNVPGSERVAFKFYVPDVAPLRHDGERIAVSLDGAPVTTTAALLPGEHDVTLEIPAALRQKQRITASLQMSRSWVPSKIGLNGDVRELSLMLLQVSYI
jgi:hypothetical protein